MGVDHKPLVFLYEAYDWIPRYRSATFCKLHCHAFCAKYGDDIDIACCA